MTDNKGSKNSDQQPAAPSQPQAPQSQPPAPQSYQAGQPGVQYAPVQNPGETTGIIGLVLNFAGINVGGIILGAISRSKSKSAGASTVLGTVSLVWGIIGTAIGFLVITFFIIAVMLAAASEIDSKSRSYDKGFDLKYSLDGVRR